MRLKWCLPVAALSIVSFSGARAQDDAAAKGKALFASNNCTLCHSADTTDMKVGPGLKGLYSRGTMADGTKVTDETVTERISNGKSPMPPYKDSLTPDQIKQIVAYLKTL